MRWQPDQVYLNGIDFFSKAVDQLETSDWQRPSPCEGWKALDVLGHVGSAVRFGTLLLRGEQPAWKPSDPPGAAVEGDPAAWWKAKVEPALEAVREADLEAVVDSPMGRRKVSEGLSFPALDLWVHAWDLARCRGAELEIPAEAIEFAHLVIDPIPADQVRSPRVFGAEQEAPDGATPTEAFIAWTGRDPRWAPNG
ncbi:MAG: TIGR03086 family protein [Candidatus Aeolococcus gillhamiae]|uniref:TIGR03086 family protein n=1 Tax=Candidatus Aeolococcus gillhamiae TaxID=3127015 RepID=A0A2W6A7A3_9BACT|nr:MAG: TIGR03086 family protein [Candidatus Dormibacter sp. RRmetagenome_bin12]